jgi:Type I phosphodiesterase / nucleotide pyrophosphatase
MRQPANAAPAFLAAALSAVTGGAVLSIVIVRSNSMLSNSDLVFLTINLTVATAIMLAAPVAAGSAALYVLGEPVGRAGIFRSAAASAAALLWFARLEPAHQLLSVRPHLYRWGAIELALLLAFSAGAILMPARVARARQLLVTFGLLAAGSIVLTVMARAIEPSPARGAEMARLAARFSEGKGPAPAGNRMLIIGIDGLEWRTIEWMLDRGRMPRFNTLLRDGRFSQLDNERMGYSAAIWTAFYSGRPRAENQIDDFVKWQFAGVSRPVTFLPRFGMHAVLFLDEWLKRTEAVGLWKAIPVASIDSPPPPVWTVASRAGKRVGVVDPLPYAATPERLNGFFVEAGGSGRFAVYRGNQRTVEEMRAAPDAGEFGEARASARVAADLFARDRPDLGVFYTHLVDTTSHEAWDFPDGRFDDTPIRRAYDAVDQMIGSLIDAFGSDATVMVVSDHGWNFDDYEHFNSPNGVLVVSPSRERGYGGVVDVLTVAPMVLGRLGVAANASLEAAGHREFVAPRFSDDERQQRLRSLGYVTGSGVKRP